MRTTSILTILIAVAPATVPAQSAAIELWNRGQVAFGVFVPSDPGARSAAFRNGLYDFLFLNLEPRYDAAAIEAAVEGIRGSGLSPRRTLLVRIPPVGRDGLEAAASRIREALALGADGVTIPHVSNVDEAKQVLAVFRDAGANVWSPSNPTGDRLAMLMIEDPGALEQAAAIAGLRGYSILACGIGSLTQALGGSREAAEAGNQRILAETKRAKLVNMLTATAQDVEARVAQGYGALIAIGRDADAAIARGRAAAGRER